MKRMQLGIMVATLALLMALPGGAAWGATPASDIDVEYDWNGTCVSNIDFVDQDDKKLELDKKKQNIRWNLEPRTGSNQVSTGNWEIEAAAPAELCKTKYNGSSSNTFLQCKVKKTIKYEYELRWSEANCNGGTPVKADPVIIFDDGGGSGFSLLTLFAVAAGAFSLTTAYLGFKLFTRKAGP